MLLIDRRFFRYFDWINFFAMMMLALIGLFFIFSATYKPEQHYSIFFKKQVFGIISGLFIYFVCCSTHIKSLLRWGYFLYFMVLALLLFTMIKGHIGMGAQRWFDLGFIRFQPSELAKLFFPIYATYYFYTENDTLSFSLKQFVPVLGILFFSFILILKQPDLGTALILLFSGLLLLWMAGLNKYFFIIMASFLLVTSPILWHLLKDYQKKRVLVFLGQGDIKKERYQIEQSLIAIGSGGIWGKGFLQGTQNKFQFLPESRTDCIFSVIAEETGLIGNFIILCLFLLLFIRSFIIIASFSSPFLQLVGLGLMLPIILSMIINIGMVTGLLPVVGIPLPLLSYGLTNLWATFASLGWFNGMAIRRFYWGE